MNNMEQAKWEIKEHSMQIADTGDYDGYWELTNGTISLVTRDEIDVDDPDSPLEMVEHYLNEAGVKWENWIEDDLRYQVHVMSENCEKWKNMAGVLYDNLKHGFSQEALVKDLENYEKLKKLLP